MKNSITSLVASGLVSCALAIGAATPSFAQSTSLVKADIPFAFQANGKLMPAGTYIIGQENGSIMRLSGWLPPSLRDRSSSESLTTMIPVGT